MIRDRILCIREKIETAAALSGRTGKDISLMAVTKTVPPERVNLALKEGVDLLGENRAQELVQKYDSYQCEKSLVHFIGHLQSNKIRDIINKVSCIESVDSLHLAEAISERSEKIGVIMPCLIEVNIGKEESKSGLYPEDVLETAEKISALSYISLRGLMTVAPAYAGKSGDDRCFGNMQELFLKMREAFPHLQIDTLSMGMSGDYELAIRHGSTLVRIGQGIFGARTLSKVSMG